MCASALDNKVGLHSIHQIVVVVLDADAAITSQSDSHVAVGVIPAFSEDRGLRFLKYED